MEKFSHQGQKKRTNNHPTFEELTIIYKTTNYLCSHLSLRLHGIQGAGEHDNFGLVHLGDVPFHLSLEDHTLDNLALEQATTQDLTDPHIVCVERHLDWQDGHWKGKTADVTFREAVKWSSG